MKIDPLLRQALILAISLAGVLVGAALIGRWALGVAVIADSVFGVWYALMSDVPERAEPVQPVVDAVFERARRSG